MSSFAKIKSKLEESAEDSSDQSDASSTNTVIEPTGIETLPCENPILNSWGVAVFGSETDPTGKPRSASTSVNRVEFPDLSSTLKPPSSNAAVASNMVWEEGTYTGFKLNCHKKKRKVENLIELYDKDSVNSVQDKEIYKEKLAEISAAALAAVEYITDLIADLELADEEDRIEELQAIKKSVTEAVKKNEKEVKLEMQRILDEAAQSQTQESTGQVTVEALKEALSGLNLGSTVSALTRPPDVGPDVAAKLALRHGHILEDAESFQKLIIDVKLAPDMTDSEVIYYMRESKNWTKQINDLVSSNRKFQEEALGKVDLSAKATELDDKIKIVKTVLENKIAAICYVDAAKGLNSLCDNKHKATVVYPDPFKGHFGENVYKFKDEIVAAITDSQVKKADQVKTLIKYLKGDAKSRVGDHQPSLEDALDVLVEFYGNPSMIWLKCRQDFEENFSGDISKHWGDLGSSRRVDAIARVMEFIRQAKQYATEYPELKNEIISSYTVTLLTKTMPIDYLEMVYLAIEDAAATPMSKIEKMEEILGKLKTCGILAVNQLVTKENSAPKSVKNQTASGRNPLSVMSGSSVCSVDIKHNCHSSGCEPSWGLLGCTELYKLKTVEQRIAYCKESKCCYICGGDMSDCDSADEKHKFHDYNNPVDRFLVKCTALRSNNPAGKKTYCFYGAALCPSHQSKPNTNSKLLDWLKKKRVKHELFAIKQASLGAKSKPSNKSSKAKDSQEMLSDKEVMEMLRKQMSESDFEDGEVEDIPEGENMFMFLLLQGKPGTEPIQVFCDSGANFWFAVESVTKKLVCVRTYKGELPINIAGGKVIYATGEWGASLPMNDGTYQGVRGLTMKSVVGQMPRYSLERTLNEVKHKYKQNAALQSLKIPEVLGGDVDMILGSKYLKIYPEPVQVTPSGLTVSVSRLRSPGGKCAVISGPIKFINQIFETKHAKDCIESMKAMLLTLSTYKPTLEYFPKPSHIDDLVDDDIPGIEELVKQPLASQVQVESLQSPSLSSFEECLTAGVLTCAVCGVTVQGELQRFMELQEAGLKSDFRCRQCRGCDDCRRGAGQEKLSMKQEAEQELVKQSVTISTEEGVAIAKLPFTLPPEENLKNNRHIALKMLDRILKKYCTDPDQRKTIMKAWDKMIDRKHLIFIDELSSEHQKMLATAKVSYWIPWNLQFKDSLSTPIRPVLNASSTTASGLSLNDCLAKGSPDLVKLLSVMLDWQMGDSAVCGDISQFYPTIKLIPEHWQYQRILMREKLDPNGKLLEAVLVKLGFGVQSVSAQSEETVRRLAKDLWDTFPAVAELLIRKRYVDDLAKSSKSKEESMKLIEDTSKILKEKLDMEIKGWSVTGEKPPPDVTKDGVSVELGGMTWFPEADLYTLNIPPICFAKKQRGKLPAGELVFDPKTMILEDYVPSKLSRRMVTSAIAKVWDLMGKTTPVTLRFKHDLRMLIIECPEWDLAISPKARALWIQNFNQIQQLRGMIYVRCNKPDDALRSTCRLWVLVDAAEWGMILTVYVGWERRSGGYSCSHLYGKGILGPEGLTLPQKELHILSKGADVTELLSVMLEDWVEEILVAGDSEIALCWAAYETVKLNQYNRVRVVNIISKINLNNLFHIKGTENPADIGTRMKSVSYEDVLPGSEYLCGRSWMKLSKEEAAKQGFIKPIEEIKLGHEQKKVMKKGIVFDSFEDEDNDAIAVMVPARFDVQKVAERLVESEYIFSPLTRNFLSFVNIVAMVLKVKKWRKLKTVNLNEEVSDENTAPSAEIPVAVDITMDTALKTEFEEAARAAAKVDPEVKPPKFSILAYYSDKLEPAPDTRVSELDRSYALEYIFSVETKIVKKFNDQKKLKKIAFEKDDILYCQTRVLEGQTVKVTGGLDIDMSLSGLFDLNFQVPLIDHHSPLAYPIALHLHGLFNHRGFESCYRLSLNKVKILGGLQLFKSISLNCVICIKDRKKYLRMVMGGLTDSQLTISPVFYFTLVDMWGPIKCYCPGYEKQTRRDKSYEVYFLVFSCVATGAVNVQLLEGKSTEFVLEGCSRFFNETSVPKIMYPDEDGALLRAFKRGEIDLEDLSGSLYRTKGILFETCPPQSHSSHGRIERVIRSLQQSFTRSGASDSRCTATGWMTMGKAMEREVNNIPIGFLFDKTTTGGNPLLRVLRPSTLKGMNASDRAPRGLFTIPDLPEKHFSKVKTAYNAWAQCWATSYLPNILLARQKWTDEDPNLAVNDIVYFKMKDSQLKIDWKIGKVDSVKLGRDGKVREVNVAYKIIKDEHWSHNVVTRPAREIIKLFGLGDTNVAEDILAVHKATKKILVRRGALSADPKQAEEQNIVNKCDMIDEAGPSVTIGDIGKDQPIETEENLLSDGTQNLVEQDQLQSLQIATAKRHTSKASSTFLECGDLCMNDFSDTHGPFLSCLKSEDWYQMGEVSDDVQEIPMDMKAVEGDECASRDFEKENVDETNEIIFSI